MNITGKKDGYHKIRPAGRHIITIGRDLIKDKYAAIVELVKNSYDADSSFCRVSLLPIVNKVEENGQIIERKGIKIEVKDDGHGMDYDTVIHKWMVPSTNDKLIRKISPEGRFMQGRKGVGRYAASMLGDDLLLETIDKKGEQTNLYLVWNDFELARYLDDVNILIENSDTSKNSCTNITITGDETHLSEWNFRQIQNLKFELKKLIPPKKKEEDLLEKETKEFKITLELGQFVFNDQLPIDGFVNIIEDIEPYPLFELYDYKINGTISNKGIANLEFHNNRARQPIEKLNEFKIFLNQDKNRKNEQAYCGEVRIDFRVFDRDSSSIDGLISRGLKDPNTGQYVGRKEARLILDNFNGIGAYRNKFRIRPLGDAGYDWLELDKERVQNPSQKIGSDQIIGFIHIEPEESSGLEEKSARDGLKETFQYFGLQEICKQALVQLEQRRFIYRRNIGLGRSSRKIDEKINTLYNFSDLKEKIGGELSSLGITEKGRESIYKIISEKETSNNKIAEELKEAIAQYQGQATLGKIVNVILHESSKPLSFFRNMKKIIGNWSNELRKNYSQEIVEKIVDRLGAIEEQSQIFIKLFDKLDPLASKKRESKRDYNVRKAIEHVQEVFWNELEKEKIIFRIDCDIYQTCYGWKEDFYIALTNLIENSIYWLQSVEIKQKEINIKAYEDDNLLAVEYRDNGPGIEKHLIESEIIFEPEFSTKSGGTGLGLAIAGEAIMRNDGELKAIYSNQGVFFKILMKIQ
jgi:signal transduction histidine kinase